MVLHRMLRLLIATYFGLVSEEGFVDLCNDSLVSKHERCICVEETPAADVSQVLVHLHCTILLHCVCH